MTKPLSRTPRALARRLKTPICKECGQPKLAETAYIPGRGKRFRFACWTANCPANEGIPGAISKDSEVKIKED